MLRSVSSFPGVKWHCDKVKNTLVSRRHTLKLLGVSGCLWVNSQMVQQTPSIDSPSVYEEPEQVWQQSNNSGGWGDRCVVTTGHPVHYEKVPRGLKRLHSTSRPRGGRAFTRGPSGNAWHRLTFLLVGMTRGSQVRSLAGLRAPQPGLPSRRQAALDLTPLWVT